MPSMIGSSAARKLYHDCVAPCASYASCGVRHLHTAGYSLPEAHVLPISGVPCAISKSGCTCGLVCEMLDTCSSMEMLNGLWGTFPEKMGGTSKVIEDRIFFSGKSVEFGLSTIPVRSGVFLISFRTRSTTTRDRKHGAWSTEVEWRTPTSSTSPNSCSTMRA